MPEKIDESTLQELKEKISAMEEELREEKKETHEAKTLFTWKSPSHVFVQRDKRWYTQTALLVILLVLILFVFNQYLLMATILAITFVVYVAASIKPEEVDHRITNLGVESLKHRYLWDELEDFWFSRRHGQEILNIETNITYPGRLTLLASTKDKEKIKKILIDYLPYLEQPKENIFDKVSEKLASLVTPSK